MNPDEINQTLCHYLDNKELDLPQDFYQSIIFGRDLYFNLKKKYENAIDMYIIKDNSIKENYVSKDKFNDILEKYKKALQDVEQALQVLKSDLLIVANKNDKIEIEKEIKFREEDKESKIIIINFLEDFLKEEY
jgi:esterase/lipase